jgi:hypothetical protein
MILTPYELATGNLLCKLQIFPFVEAHTYIFFLKNWQASLQQKIAMPMAQSRRVRLKLLSA